MPAGTPSAPKVSKQIRTKLRVFSGFGYRFPVLWMYRELTLLPRPQSVDDVWIDPAAWMRNQKREERKRERERASERERERGNKVTNKVTDKNPPLPKNPFLPKIRLGNALAPQLSGGIAVPVGIVRASAQ